FLFFFQAEDGIRDRTVTGVQTCALPISAGALGGGSLAIATAVAIFALTAFSSRAFWSIMPFEYSTNPAPSAASKMPAANIVQPGMYSDRAPSSGGCHRMLTMALTIGAPANTSGAT